MTDPPFSTLPATAQPYEPLSPFHPSNMQPVSANQEDTRRRCSPLAYPLPHNEKGNVASIDLVSCPLLLIGTNGRCNAFQLDCFDVLLQFRERHPLEIEPVFPALHLAIVAVESRSATVSKPEPRS